MKNTLLLWRVFGILILVFLNSHFLKAQYNMDAPWMSEIKSNKKSEKKNTSTFHEIVDAFNVYWENRDFTEKGSGHKPFKRWEEFHKNGLMSDGTIPTPDFYWNIWEQRQGISKNAKNDEYSWTPMGPFDHDPLNSWSPGQGRINVAIVDPNQPNVMYVGAPAGGIWKSIDNGANWEPLSDYLPQIGVSGIAIDYNDSDTVYISTGDDDASDALGIGVLKSVDGGYTWSKTGLDASDDYEIGNDIYIDPDNSNKLWVATSRGVYKTEDAGATWAKTLFGNIKDIKIKPGDTNVIYAATSSVFYKSTDGGNTFSVVQNGLPVNSSRLVIDVTPANPEYVYLLSAASNRSFQGLYKSMDSGGSFSKTQETENIFESTQSWYDLALSVSDEDPNLVFVGCLNVWKSVNGGDDFSRINRWNRPNEPTYTHADIHFLRYYNGRLLCGSDGGIYESQDNGESFVDLTKGLQIGQFYKISVAENSSSDHLVGGLQDNGGYAFDGDQWNVYHGADGMDCAVQGNNENTYFGFTQYGGSLYKTEDRGGSRTFAGGGPETGNWVTPLVSDRNGVLYAGFGSFYKHERISFTNQTEFDFGEGNIDHIELDPSDTNIIYVANDRNLYKSIDKGVNWSLIYTFNRFVTAIEVHNDNNQILYVATSGVGGNILKSNDQGNSFSDISENLSDEGKFVIKHHKGTETIYLGTYLGVYVKDGDQPWQEYNTNLPNVAVRDLEINLKESVLLAATYGRGVWKAPLQTVLPLDSLVPTTPLDLAAISMDQSSVQLSWSASSDNIAVTGYDIYQGSDFVKYVNETSATIQGLSANTEYQFSVVAKDNRGNQSAFSEVVSVRTEGIAELVYNFYKPQSWSDPVNVYFFSATSNATLPETNSWPGQVMDRFPTTNWYSYTLPIPEGVNPDEIRMVFNGNAGQTDDLARSTSGWYQDGVWSDDCVNDCDALNQTVIDIYFNIPTFAWNGSSHIYIYDKARNVTLENTAGWPGQEMTVVSGSVWGKWSFIIPNGVSPEDVGVVFNDGNGSQTIDLTRGKTGWFTRTFPNEDGKFNGFWSDICPAACNIVPLKEEHSHFLEEHQKIVISPNPIKGQYSVQLYAAHTGVLEIAALNILGQKKTVYKQFVDAGNHTVALDKNSLTKAGMYLFVTYLDGKKMDVTKVIAQ